jgi:hypothetical protein
MLKWFSVAVTIAAVISMSPTQARQRACSADEENKMIRQCGGYVVWINPGKNDCSFGFKGDRYYCETKSGYLACEQKAQILGCRRPLNNQ